MGTTLLHTFCNTGSIFSAKWLRLVSFCPGGVSKSSVSNLKGVLLALKLEECPTLPQAQPIAIYTVPPVSRH